MESGYIGTTGLRRLLNPETQSFYVDALLPALWRYRKSCHLFTDGDLEALHAFAASLGLRRSWFQNHSRLPHYDLTASKRALAICMGAVEANRRKVVACMRPRDR